MTDYKALYEQSQKENMVMRKVIKGAKTSQEQEFQQVLEKCQILIKSLQMERIYTDEQIEELKEKNTELKEKLDSICIELYACWNCSCDLDDENIGDICGYDEDKHKKLYEKKYPGTLWSSEYED